MRLRGRLEIPDTSRNPGAFDYRSFLARNGIYATLRVRRKEDWQIIGERGASGNPVQQFAYALRQAVMRHTFETLPLEHASLLNGILLGARNHLPGPVNDQFQRTGTSHLLAASGMNVALVVVLALALLRRLGLRYRPAYAGALLAVWFFALMADLSPSILRAALVATVYIGGILLEREPDFLNAVALAALLPLLFHPLDLFDIGFQLSYAAVLSIALFLPFMQNITQRLRNRLKGEWPGAKPVRAIANGLVLCFLLTLCAQIGTAPLTAYYYNHISLVGLVVNGLLGPWIGGVIALGFTAAALSVIHPHLSAPFDGILNLIMAGFLTVVAWGSSLPFASIAIPSPPVWGLVLYYALILLFAIRLNRMIGTNSTEDEEEPDL
jgi:competence protein ComEC